MTMRDATIVILSKKVDLVRAAVASVIATHRSLTWCEFLIVDDGLADRPALFDRIAYCDGIKPFSFAGNVNVALRHVAPDRDVVLMNDDVRCVTPDALGKLRWAAYQRPRIGIATAVTIPRGWDMAPSPAPPHVHDEQADEIWTETDHTLAFPLVYLKRDLIQDVGLMDESLVGYGYDDYDYCLRAYLAGFEVVVMPRVLIAHGDDRGGSVSFREHTNIKEMFSSNRARYIRKWCTSYIGLTPAQTERMMWFARFSFERSLLPDRARSLLGLGSARSD
jgi:GT2 family glycosyltransferase